MPGAAARATILAQHVELRGLLERALVMARRHVAGTAIDRELDELVASIRDAFEVHNRYESALLTPLLSATGAWGPARIERMVAEHVEEHQVIQTFLSRPAHEVIADLADFVEEIDAHMEAEERTFLSPDVLTDRE